MFGYIRVFQFRFYSKTNYIRRKNVSFLVNSAKFHSEGCILHNQPKNIQYSTSNISYITFKVVLTRSTSFSQRKLSRTEKEDANAMGLYD